MSESFVDFFTNKIVRFRNDLDTFSRIPNDSHVTPCSTKTESCLACQFLSEFRLVDEEVISGYVNNLWTKSCALDPIPWSVFQRCEHRLVPIITRTIVNLSLQGGQVPDRFKVAVIKPLLKKSGADREDFSNFQPVSNLYFLSKVTEKAVAAQLCDHLNGKDGLLEEFQSAYKCCHSTETALVRVHNNILKTVDDNKSVILLLLDLSAAFDTVDPTILVSGLANRFGIRDTALNSFLSYLQLRKQFVSVNGIDSSLNDLQYGVPQGSRVSYFTVARKHGIPFHLYTDETRLHLSFYVLLS